jgi:hypothetical protein
MMMTSNTITKKLGAYIGIEFHRRLKDLTGAQLKGSAKAVC